MASVIDLMRDYNAKNYEFFHAGLPISPTPDQEAAAAKARKDMYDAKAKLEAALREHPDEAYFDDSFLEDPKWLAEEAERKASHHPPPSPPSGAYQAAQRPKQTDGLDQYDTKHLSEFFDDADPTGLVYLARDANALASTNYLLAEASETREDEAKFYRKSNEARQRRDEILDRLKVADPAAYDAFMGQYRTAAPPPPPENLDTGHYDDAHSFGWKQPDRPDWTHLAPSMTTVDEAMDKIKAEDEATADDDAPVSLAVPAGGRPKWVLPAVIGGGLLVVLLGGLFLLGGSSESNNDDAAAITTESSSSRSESTQTVAPTAGPIRYQTNCSGPQCFTIDTGSCVWTFHYDLTVLGDTTALVGKTAVIETPGIGLAPRYEVPVAPGGKVVLEAPVDMKPLGATPQNGCAPTSAHFTAYITSVDGKPTITPNAPP